MLTLTTIAYARRQNPDGRAASACIHCFVTVIADLRQADLERAEQHGARGLSVQDHLNKEIDHQNYDYE
jgi:hypothetical protein